MSTIVYTREMQPLHNFYLNSFNKIAESGRGDCRQHLRNWRGESFSWEKLVFEIQIRKGLFLIVDSTHKNANNTPAKKLSQNKFHFFTPQANVSRDRNASCTWKMSWWHVSAAPRRNFASRLHTHTVIILGAPGHKFHSTPARRLSAKKKSAGVHTHTHCWFHVGSRACTVIDHFAAALAPTRVMPLLVCIWWFTSALRVTASRRAMQIAALHIPTSKSIFVQCMHAHVSLSLAWHTSLSQSAKGKAPREPRSGVREAPLNWRPHSLCDPNTHTHTVY